jgi:hypothetical protein
LSEQVLPHESRTKRLIDEIVRRSSLVVFVSESMSSFYLDLWRERNLNPHLATLVVPTRRTLAISPQLPYQANLRLDMWEDSLLGEDSTC